jgi:hypothetical protein
MRLKVLEEEKNRLLQTATPWSGFTYKILFNFGETLEIVLSKMDSSIIKKARRGKSGDQSFERTQSAR